MAERIELILAPGAGSINSEFQVTELRVGNSSESFILRRLNRSKNIGHSYYIWRKMWNGREKFVILLIQYKSLSRFIFLWLPGFISLWSESPYWGIFQYSFLINYLCCSSERRLLMNVGRWSFWSPRFIKRSGSCTSALSSSIFLGAGGRELNLLACRISLWLSSSNTQSAVAVRLWRHAFFRLEHSDIVGSPPTKDWEK